MAIRPWHTVLEAASLMTPEAAQSEERDPFPIRGWCWSRHGNQCSPSRGGLPQHKHQQIAFRGKPLPVPFPSFLFSPHTTSRTSATPVPPPSLGPLPFNTCVSRGFSPSSALCTEPREILWFGGTQEQSCLLFSQLTLLQLWPTGISTAEEAGNSPSQAGQRREARPSEISSGW